MRTLIDTETASTPVVATLSVAYVTSLGTRRVRERAGEDAGDHGPDDNVRGRTQSTREPAQSTAARTSAPTLTRAVRFPLGRLVATPGALDAIAVAEAHRGHGARRTGAESEVSGSILAGLIACHAAGEWGTVDAEDWAANDRALRDGTRLLSAYRLATGARVWIITEADRSTTSVLLPDEY